MKRFTLFVAATAAVVIVLAFCNEALNRYLIFSTFNAKAYKMYRLFANPEPGEIAIVGSSRAEANIAPREISGVAFNYGLSGSPFRETVFHLKALMARRRAGLVIVNLDPWGLGKGDFQGRYRFVYDEPLVKAEPMVKIPWTDRIPGLRCQGETRANLAEYVNNRLAVTKTMERGAILQRISRSEDEWQYIIGKCKPRAFQLDAEIKAMLEEILKSNERHEIVFAVSPVAKPWWNLYSGKAELKKLESWLGAFPRVHVLDYVSERDDYGLDEFMDLTHLNERGARRFSRELRIALQDLGLL